MDSDNNTKRYQTFGVLAGAYLRSSDPRSCLTHVWELETLTDRLGDPFEYPVGAPLCKRVKPEHVCPDGYTEAELEEPATCKTCARRDPRRK